MAGAYAVSAALADPEAASIREDPKLLLRTVCWVGWVGLVATSGCASAAGMPAMHACMDATGPSGRTETGAFCSEEFSNDAIEYVGMIAGVEESFRFTAI